MFIIREKRQIKKIKQYSHQILKQFIICYRNFFRRFQFHIFYIGILNWMIVIFSISCLIHITTVNANMTITPAGIEGEQQNVDQSIIEKQNQKKRHGLS